MKDGTFNTVIDVRTQEEWDEGHIENATFVPGRSVVATLLPNCNGCTMVLYCASGNRAGAAIERLLAAGYSGAAAGKLYNGLGVGQWTAAGYPLVTTTPSVDPECLVSQGDRCRKEIPKVKPPLPPSKKRKIINGDGGERERGNTRRRLSQSTLPIV